MKRTLVTGALTFLVACPSAHAAYPGSNGKIAYGDNGEIAVSNPDGSGESILTQALSGNFRHPVFSPNGQRIAFVNYTDETLWVMNADGSGAVSLGSAGDVKSRPTWSPDGSQIAFGREGTPFDIVIVDSDTGAVEGNVLPPDTEDINGRYSDPAWHPTNPGLFAVSYFQIGTPPVPSFTEIATVSTSGGMPTVLTGSADEESEPDWAPDGSRIIYERLDLNTPAFRIYAVSAGGGAQEQLVANGREPFHSPDGTLIGFTLNGAIQIALADGSGADPAIPAISTQGSWQPAEGQDVELIVNTPDDRADTSVGDGSCDSNDNKPNDQCTLRAAIQEANDHEGPDEIDFRIKQKDSKTIAPESPLPAITEATTVDGLSQPGAGQKPLVQLSGAEIPQAAGLVLEGESSEVSGMRVTSFKRGTGIELAGDGNHTLTKNWFGYGNAKGTLKALPNGTGASVTSASATLADNTFTAAGNLKEATEYLEGLDREGTTPEAQVITALRNFGSGIHVDGGSEGTVIQNNTFGLTPSGDRVGSLDLGEDAKVKIGNVAGVLIAPASGSVSDVTVGGDTDDEGNVFSGNFGAVMALGGGGGIDGLEITHNAIGPGSFTKPPAGVGNLFGVLAGGSVADLTVGGSGALGNQIQGNFVGIAAGGPEIENAVIQGNEIGSDDDVDRLFKSLDESKPKLGRGNFFGTLLADTQGVQFGGAGALGNDVFGNLLHLMLVGPNSEGNSVLGNAFGRSEPPGGRVDELELKDAGGLLGLVVEGSNQVVGAPGAGNTFIGNAFAVLDSDTSEGTYQANVFDKNAIGYLGAFSNDLTIGGTDAGEGNSYVRNALGLAQVGGELTKQDRQATQTDETPTGAKQRKEPLKADNTDTALNTLAPLAGGADLSADAAVVDGSGSESGHEIQGNFFGTDAGGAELGNWVAAALGGTLTQTTFGTGADSLSAGANVVAHNRLAGVIAGDLAGESASEIDLRGNSIFGNGLLSGPVQFQPATGIDLVPGLPGPLPPGTGLGVTENDPGDTDDGANGLQNFPEIATATTAPAGSGTALTVAGALSSRPSETYSIELYASASCGKLEFGEGQTLIKRYDVSTNGSGQASIDTTATLPAGQRRLTATATGPEGTSEFSQCVTVP